MIYDLEILAAVYWATGTIRAHQFDPPDSGVRSQSPQSDVNKLPHTIIERTTQKPNGSEYSKEVHAVRAETFVSSRHLSSAI